MNQQLVDYMQQQLNLGYDIDSIKNFLLQQGYPQEDVDESAASISGQRLLPLINYIKDALAKGFEPDAIKSQLLAMGYPAADINSALAGTQAKPGLKLGAPAIAGIFLVALIIFGLGLFFFWPSGQEETPGSDIIQPAQPGDEGTGADDEAISFQTTPTAPVDTQSEPEDPFAEYPGFEAAEVELNKTDAAAPPQEEAPQEPAPESNPQFAEYSDMMSGVSKESDVDSAMNLCKNEENVVFRDACYDQISKSFESPLICSRIEDQSLRDSCYMNIVLKKKDYALCDSIIDQTIKGSCLTLKDTPPAANMTLEDMSDLLG